MDSYLTKLVITHYHIYFDVQILSVWPAGAHRAGSSVFLILGSLCSRSMLYFLCPSQVYSLSSKSYSAFYLFI